MTGCVYCEVTTTLSQSRVAPHNYNIPQGQEFNTKDVTMSETKIPPSWGEKRAFGGSRWVTNHSHCVQITSSRIGAHDLHPAVGAGGVPCEDQ